MSHADQVEARSDLEEEQIADVTLYCLTDEEVKDHSKQTYNSDRPFMKFKCPECKEDITVLVDDMADFFGDNWFDLDKIYDLDTNKACEVLGVCPHCTRDLDLKKLFAQALKDYKEKYAREVEFRRQEFIMESAGTYID